MFNDFVTVGPSDDPAAIGTESATEAFDAIAAAEATFVSRGDESGTHTKELAIWDAAETTDDDLGEWYREAGQGMGEVLTQADQSGGYTLADRGTYLSMQSDIDLEILVEGPIEGGPELLANPYGIAAVNPAVHENVEYDLSMAYIGYLTSAEGQRLIEEYAVDGEQAVLPRGAGRRAELPAVRSGGLGGSDRRRLTRDRDDTWNRIAGAAVDRVPLRVDVHPEHRLRLAVRESYRGRAEHAV